MKPLHLRTRAHIFAVRLANAFLRLRLRLLHFRFQRLLARYSTSPSGSDSNPPHAPIQVLLLNCDIHHPTPRGAQLLNVSPTFEAICQVLGGAVAPFDAGFMDVIGFSHDLSFATWSPPTPIYPCGAEVFRLGPVVFAGMRDQIPDGETQMAVDGGAMHLLGALSLIAFEELLDFYLPGLDTSDKMAATRAFGAKSEWNWGQLPTPNEPNIPSYAREPRIVKHLPIPLPAPADPTALFSDGPLRLFTLRFEALPHHRPDSDAVRLTVEFVEIAHSYAALTHMFSGPVVGFRTPFDSVVALGADPQSMEGREALFELKFPQDLARFPEMLPLVGFVCGSPLLDPVMGVERFSGIESDQVEQVVEVFARHLTGGAREMVLWMLELGSAWSADLYAG